MNQMARRIVVTVVVILVIAAGLWFASRIPRTISIFLIAAFIAFGAHPLVKRLERRRLPRPASIAVVYVTLLGALIIVALVVIPITVGQLGVLVNNAPQFVAGSQTLAGHLDHALRHVSGNRVGLPPASQVQTEVGNRVSGLLSSTFAQIGPMIVGTVSALLVGTSALILSVFFLLQGREVREGILAFVPPVRRPGVAELMHELADVFGHYVSGQALVCTIVGVAVYAALLPSHFGFALLVALLCAFCYAVPFVGMIVAQLVAALLAVPQGTTMVIWVTVAIFVIARVADNVLVPKVMGRSLGVSPITVMFAVFAGGELFGLPGLILGIPAAALLKVLFGYFVQPYVVRMQAAPVRNRRSGDRAAVEVEVTVEEPGGPEPVVVTVSP